MFEMEGIEDIGYAISGDAYESIITDDLSADRSFYLAMGLGAVSGVLGYMVGDFLETSTSENFLDTIVPDSTSYITAVGATIGAGVLAHKYILPNLNNR